MQPSQRLKLLSELEVGCIYIISSAGTVWSDFVKRWKDNYSAEEQLEWPSLPDLQQEVWVRPQGHLGRIRILWNPGAWDLPAEGKLAWWCRYEQLIYIYTYVKGDTLEERYLAIVILTLEGFPQFMLLSLTMIHWHSPFRSEALELFREARYKNKMIIRIISSHFIIFIVDPAGPFLHLSTNHQNWTIFVDLCAKNKVQLAAPRT